MDTPDKPPLYLHLASAGGISRSNPELVRLHKATGFSLEHLFKVATGQRRASRPLALAVANHARNRAVTAESILAQPVAK